MTASSSQPRPEDSTPAQDEGLPAHDQYGTAADWAPSLEEREEEELDKEIATAAAESVHDEDDNADAAEEKLSEGEGEGGSEKDGQGSAQRRQLARLQSTITETSIATTTAGTQSPDDAKRKWYQRLNPLRWGKVPPVPEERTVCPEANASFFSMLIFQWMAPLMSVRETTLTFTQQ
jgi:ATP-binding cassette subfamily C (CFTR/MRP) protein 1